MSLWKERPSKRKVGITPAFVGAILAMALVALLTTGCGGVSPTPAAPTTAAPTPEPEPTPTTAAPTPEPEPTPTSEPEATDTPEPEAQPPTAVISVSIEGETARPIAGPALVPAGQPIYFMGADSVPGSSPITSYQWDFGANEVVQDQVVAHMFNVPGVYSVTLTITDENGESNTAVQQVTVDYVH